MYSHVFGAFDRRSVGWTKAARQQRPSFTGVWRLWSSECWVNESSEATEAIIHRCLAPVVVGVLGEPETLYYTCCSISGWTKAVRQQRPRGKKHKLSVRLLNCLVTTVITDWCTLSPADVDYANGKNCHCFYNTAATALCPADSSSSFSSHTTTRLLLFFTAAAVTSNNNTTNQTICNMLLQTEQMWKEHTEIDGMARKTLQPIQSLPSCSRFLERINAEFCKIEAEWTHATDRPSENQGTQRKVKSRRNQSL